MNNRFRRPRIIAWELDGAFITVTYTQEDGQRVTADFKRGFWHQPPADLRETVKRALALGPKVVYGNRGGR